VSTPESLRVREETTVRLRLRASSGGYPVVIHSSPPKGGA